jgi:hypothetical protein
MYGGIFMSFSYTGAAARQRNCSWTDTEHRSLLLRLKEAHALARAAFTVEDLLRFTESVEDVPAEEAWRELEEAQKHFDNRETS